MPGTPPLVPVTSSSIAAIGYDVQSALLVVEFCDGTLYEYVDVSSSVHEGLMASASHGRYFDVAIRPYYQFRRIR